MRIKNGGRITPKLRAWMWSAKARAKNYHRRNARPLLTGGGTALGMMPSQMIRTPNYREIEAKAIDILKKYIVSKPPVPIKSIVEDNGVKVTFVSFNNLSDEVAGLTEFDKGRILVNADDGPRRQTFTIAHEFGHWILHRDLFIKSPEKYAVLLRRQSSGRNTDPLEKEANAFAANILVPRYLLSSIKDLVGTAELARIFAVSEETMQYRLEYV